MSRAGDALTPRACSECGEQIVIALLAGATAWARFDARAAEPFTQAAVAWKPDDLVEHFLVRNETTLTAARDLAAGYPAHRRHYHLKKEAADRG